MTHTATDLAALDDAGLRRLVETFYARVRQDALIGPLFNEAIDDWPHHLKSLASFWNSVMLGSGRYKGQPVPAHMKHRAHITPAMFDRWLELWRATTDELMAPEAAAALQAKAERIADSLQLALFFRPERPGTKGNQTMPPEPYQSTPVFDADSLPAAIRNEHRTKEGTWGLLRVLEGRVTLVFIDPAREVEVTPGNPAAIPPQAAHYVKLEGPMRMQVDFYREPPLPVG